MSGSATADSPALRRYNALRDQGVEPDEAAAKVRAEFPEIEASHPRATVTAGPIASIGTPDSERARIAPPTAFNSETLRQPARPRPISPVVADATAVKVTEKSPPPREMTIKAAPEPAEPTIGAAPRRTAGDYTIPEATVVDKWRQWRDKNAEQTLAAFDPEKMGTPEGQEAMLNIVMNVGEGPKIVGDAAKKAGRVTAEEMLEVGKRRAAELESGLPPHSAPDLTPAMEREGKMFGEMAPSTAVSVPESPRPAFPDPKPARAAGKIIPDVPLIRGPYKGDPGMFKERDFDLSPEGRAQFEEMLGPTGIKERVTWKDAEALAVQIGTDPAKILRNVRDLSGEEILAVKQAIATDTERVVHLSKIASDPKVTREARDAALQEIDRRSSDLAQYAARVTRETSRTGRDLNLMKVMARNTMEPSVWLVQASRMKGLPLTPEETVSITRLAAQRDREGLFDALSNLKTLDPLDKALTVWKAGLLTNPITHGVNITGNTAMAIMEQAKDAPAAVVDLMLSLGTGTRSKAMPSARGVVASVRGAMTNGLDAAKAVLRTGASPEDLAKWDFRNGRFGTTLGSDKLGAVLDIYTQSVFRSLGAEDQIFKAAAVGRSLDEQIRVEAINIAKRTKRTKAPISVAEAVTMLRANVPDAMQAQAIADAEYATFQNENLIAGGVSAGKRYLGSKGLPGNLARAVVELNLPFIKTPTNVLERTLDYTPAGILRAVAPAWKMAKGADMNANQRKVAEAFGRSSIGSLAIWLGYEMAGKDMATGTMPLGAKDEWDVRGRIAGAVRTSPQGDWHQVVRMQPLGTLIALGAQLRTITDNASSASDVVGGALASTGKLVADQPFLQGIQNISEAVGDPENRGGRWLRSTAASAVPAGVAAVAREVDPIDRDPKTFVESVAARIPGISRSVPAKLNVFGQEQSHASFPLAQLVDVTRSRKNTETPALAELRRLGIRVGKPDNLITVNGETYALAPEEYRALLQRVGPETERLLEAALASPVFTKEGEAPAGADLARGKALSNAISQARRRYEGELASQIYAAKQGNVPHVGTLRVRRPKF